MHNTIQDVCEAMGARPPLGSVVGAEHRVNYPVFRKPPATRGTSTGDGAVWCWVLWLSMRNQVVLYFEYRFKLPYKLFTIHLKNNKLN